MVYAYLSVAPKPVKVILPSLLTVLLPETQVGSVAAAVAVGKAVIVKVTLLLALQVLSAVLVASTRYLYTPAAVGKAVKVAVACPLIRVVVGLEVPLSLYHW